ncbi:MAG: ClpXP protease specificity-enhancing factor [Vibrionaceae bacterium]
MEPKFTARRPHLMRAFYDWLLENGLTPHIVVDATLPHVQVPSEYVRDGKIVLNITPRALGDLHITSESISFNARFSGEPMHIIVPMYALEAIYARENGMGTEFGPESYYDELLEQLSRVREQPVMGVIEGDGVAQDQSVDNGENTAPQERKKGPPTLTVVK